MIEDAGGLRARVLASLLDRRKWPAIPAILLVTTLFTLALSGFRGGDSDTTAATASPTQSTAPPAVTQRPSITPEPDPTPTAPPTAAPTAAPTATRAPAETFRTYRIESGDTLSAIAAEFGTTTRAIADLNGIAVNSTLRIGQVLKIPN